MQRTNFRTGKVAKNDNRQLSLIYDIEKASGYRYIYTDTTYASSTLLTDSIGKELEEF